MVVVAEDLDLQRTAVAKSVSSRFPSLAKVSPFFIIILLFIWKLDDYALTNGSYLIKIENVCLDLTNV